MGEPGRGGRAEVRLTGEHSRIATKVLVVDDEADVEVLFRQRFRRPTRQGELELSFAGNGRQALEVLRADPDLRIVLTDINMPEMDGLTLISHVQELDRRVQVVIMSAYGDMKNIRTAMNRGAFDFLTKPLDFADLETTLDKTLEQVRAFLEAEEARRRAEELEAKNGFIREIFGRYVSQDVVDHLLDSPEGLRLGGEKRHVTLLVAELKGFAALAERLAPEDVVRMLNRWFDAMFDVAADHGGTISDVGGAGCQVLFGVPLTMDRGARRALGCALAMRARLERLNETADGGVFPQVEMGVGVHTGVAVIGNVGSDRRARYGAVGSEINLAERIESYATAGQILVSDATLREAGDGIRVDATMDLHPRGIERRVTVHDLAGLEAG